MGIDLLKQRRAIFLDRDGVINRNVFNPSTRAWESPLTPEQLELIPGALDAMRALMNAGFLLFVVSNQPNVAKGKTSLATLETIQHRLLDLLSEGAIEIAAFYYCLHHPDGVVAEYSGPCSCRKPSPYFLLQARDHFSLDLENSWMIGDRASDVACGLAAGVHTVRIIHAEEGVAAASALHQAEFTVNSLAAAAAVILRRT